MVRFIKFGIRRYSMIMDTRNKEISHDIRNFDLREWAEIIDLDGIEERVITCLGPIDVYELWNQKLSYSFLWCELFKAHNKGKKPEDRISGPVLLLEYYCGLYKEIVELQSQLSVPLEFSQVFLYNSRSLTPPELPRYFSFCRDTLKPLVGYVYAGESLHNQVVLEDI